MPPAHHHIDYDQVLAATAQVLLGARVTLAGAFQPRPSNQSYRDAGTVCLRFWKDSVSYSSHRLCLAWNDGPEVVLGRAQTVWTDPLLRFMSAARGVGPFVLAPVLLRHLDEIVRSGFLLEYVTTHVGAAVHQELKNAWARTLAKSPAERAVEKDLDALEERLFPNGVCQRPMTLSDWNRPLRNVLRSACWRTEREVRTVMDDLEQRWAALSRAVPLGASPGDSTTDPLSDPDPLEEEPDAGVERLLNVKSAPVVGAADPLFDGADHEPDRCGGPGSIRRLV